MTDLEYFRATYGLSEADVLLVPYGSRVYGTHSQRSDYDYIAIVPANRNADTGTEYRHGDVNIHIYNRWDFQHQLQQHKIHALEAYFLKPADGQRSVRAEFEFDLRIPVLREAISEKSNHSFVKAKKKIEVEGDYYVGWKSLFHSLRILTFGIQIARDGAITDYAAANQHWFDILNAQQYKWAYFKEKYQPVYNKLASEFRALAPKDDPLLERQLKKKR